MSSLPDTAATTTLLLTMKRYMSFLMKLARGEKDVIRNFSFFSLRLCLSSPSTNPISDRH